MFNFKFTNPDEFNVQLHTLYPADNGIPEGGEPGALLTKVSLKDFDAEWILPVNQVIQGNDGPVTSDAVYIAITDAVDIIMSTCAPIYQDTQENWDSRRSLISENKAIYVYTNHSYMNDGYGGTKAVPALKIGDGTSYLIDLPFVNQKVEIDLANHINNYIIHVTQQDKNFWNGKVSCSVNDETLIFSTQ